MSERDEAVENVKKTEGEQRKKLDTPLASPEVASFKENPVSEIQQEPPKKDEVKINYFEISLNHFCLKIGL